MQFSTLFSVALLALGATASKHKYCNCHVDGVLDKNLSHDTCVLWGSIYPNTEWVDNRASCHDYHGNGGIEGGRWESLCRAVHEGDDGGVRGNCFEN
ncbi:hypothetical protein F5Y03DRAFT_396690 [Xylaria venustula]|nr:hypothetical protein F5Y03DRAFT_396690 [Xylaria venustula]